MENKAMSSGKVEKASVLAKLRLGFSGDGLFKI
jgi:hypothetical protein